MEKETKTRETCHDCKTVTNDNYIWSDNDTIESIDEVYFLCLDCMRKHIPGFEQTIISQKKYENSVIKYLIKYLQSN